MKPSWTGPLLSLLAVALGLLLWPYTVDDAYVIGVYARRLASLGSYNFVDGPPTDGVTGPPWLMVGTLAAALGLDPVAAAKAVGLLSGALSVGWLHHAAMKRVVGTLSAPVAAAFLLLAPSYLAWCVAGLETGLAALAVTGLSASVLLAPRPLTAGACAALLVSLRPECVPLTVVLLAHLWRRRGKRALPAMALAALGLLAVMAFRWALFGTIDPLSAAAKPPELDHGVIYALRVLTYGTAITGLPMAMLAARGSRRMRVLGVALLAHVAAITLAGGDWMPGVRLFVPAMPLLAWMVGVGTAELLRRRSSRLALGLSIALLLGAPLALFVIETARAREAGEHREHEGRALVDYLDAHAHRVALIDIGFVAYTGSFATLDLAGITDPSIGRLPGGHLDKPVTGAMLIDRDVDALVLHAGTEPGVDGSGHLVSLSGFGIERRLAMDENIRGAFEVTEVMQYAEGYWYVVLLRR